MQLPDRYYYNDGGVGGGGPTKFPIVPSPRHQQQGYYGAEEDDQQQHYEYDPRYHQAAVPRYAEQPMSPSHGPILQNTSRNVAATSYLPPPHLQQQHGYLQQQQQYGVDMTKDQEYFDRRGMVARTRELVRHDGGGEVRAPATTSRVVGGPVTGTTGVSGSGGVASSDGMHFPRDGLVFMRFYDDKCQCSSCNTLGDSFEHLSMLYRQASFFDANINANGRALHLLKIDYLPTVIAFRDRREIGRYFGTELDKLEAFVHQMAHKL